MVSAPGSPRTPHSQYVLAPAVCAASAQIGERPARGDRELVRIEVADAADKARAILVQSA